MPKLIAGRDKLRLVCWIVALPGCLALVAFNLRGLAGVPVTGLPDYFIFPGNDLVVYLRGGQAFLAGETPYPTGDWPGPAVFHYSPTAAWFLAQLAAPPIPFRCLAYLHLISILVALPLTWLAWRAALREMYIKEGAAAMVAWLPLWLIYSQWFADQNFLNIYTFLLLFDGLLVLAIWRRRLFFALLLALLIAQTKPHYLYPLLLPLLLGRWRFFVRLMGGFVTGYLLLAGATMLAAGPTYGLVLYHDYFTFLTTIAARYPWSAYYLGYNHSWQSILNWLFGLQPWIPPTVLALRLLLLLPLLWLGWGWWRWHRTEGMPPAAALGLALAAHLWAILSLDQLWEATTAIIVFNFLWATGTPPVRHLAMLFFIPFAGLGLAQLAGWQLAWRLGLPGDQLDPAAHLPLIMVTTLGLYGLLLLTARSLLRN